MSGAIIVFSGVDGAGKTTQIEMLRQRLRRQGKETVSIWTRGGYTSLLMQFKRIARLVFRRQIPPPGRNERRTKVFKRRWIRRLWLVSSILDLFRVYSVQLRWWRFRNKIVICDRYVWDTLVDFRVNFPEEQIEKWLLWRLLVWTAARPTQSFLMLIPVEESLVRSQRKSEPFPDSREVLEKRLEYYAALAELGYWNVLDGKDTPENLSTTIWNLLNIS